MENAPLPEPATPEVPDVERFPDAPASPTQSPQPPKPASLTPPAQRIPTAAPDVQPPTGRAPDAPPALPQLPGLPAPPPTAPPAPRAPTAAPQPPAARVLAPPAAPEPEPQRQTAMEQLRTKVQTLDLQVEAAPQASTVPTPQRERNVLSLRIYSNRVREAVKEQYTFPGGFDENLRARVRVVLNRDGSVRTTELLESSGNERFDRLVCLAAFNKARIPPIPAGLEADGDRLTLHFTCSP